MNKTWLIIKREFRTRVRKKSFLIMTILGPILMAAVFILPVYFATLPSDDRVIVVLDEPLLLDFEKGKNNIKLNYLPNREFDFETAKEFFKRSDAYAFLHIPLSSGDPEVMARSAILLRNGSISLGVEDFIESTIEKYIQKEKLKAQGVDPEVIAMTKTKVNIKTINLDEGDEVESMAEVQMILGYLCGFLIYIFVFLYGAQVMRGVIEEKTSRIVEVMISSVKPFQLMMGKIIGLAGVALVQFSIWLVFGTLIYSIASSIIIGNGLDPEMISSQAPVPEDTLATMRLIESLQALPILNIILAFLFYFLFGYLLYAAIFAAIGSAVDKESDTQQFMLPVSLPLIASIVVLIRALDDPEGSIATWFSIIPFTSPIVMMARIPFGVPWWEQVLSMSLLFGSFILMTWLAGRIYRIGILMYGKKAKFSELFKWIGYKEG